MKVTQREENRLELGLLGAHFKSLLCEVVEGLMEIGLHPPWRFVGDLDGCL